jgi:hypothetical protein
LEAIHKEVMLMRFKGGNGQALKGNPIKIPVQIKISTTVYEIKDGEVVLMNTNYEKEVVKVDTVIIGKTEPNTELYDSLITTGLKVANIGDSKFVRNVRGAMTDGAEAGLIIDDDIFMNANNVLSNALPKDVKKMMI